MSNTQRYIRFFKDIGIEDVPLVGGKNASLGEMFRELSTQGVRVPNGFAIVADAYWHMLEHAGALPALKEALAGLDPANVGDLAARAQDARHRLRGRTAGRSQNRDPGSVSQSTRGIRPAA